MLRQYKTWLKKYKSNKDGATALEFGLLVTPFLMLLFAIVELAVVFFFNSSLTHAMNETSRDVRTGEFQTSCGGATEFRTNICDRMVMGSCDNLRIDVVTSPSGRFQPNLLPPTPTVEDPSNPGEPQRAPDNYTDSQARAVVVVRAQYYYKLAFPGAFTRLSNQPGNYRVITSSTAFRNEPFPAGGCAT